VGAAVGTGKFIHAKGNTMLVISKSKDKTLNWPVSVSIAADGGRTVEHIFTGTFKVLDEDERETLFPDAADKLPTSSSLEAAVDDILKVMTDWKNVVDENRNPIDFNRETLLTAVRSASGYSVLQGIWEAMRQVRVGARAKN
jgi:hypothetical protein